MPAGTGTLNFAQQINYLESIFGVSSTLIVPFAGGGTVNLTSGAAGSAAATYKNCYAAILTLPVTPTVLNLTSGLTNPDGTAATFADIVLLTMWTPPTNGDFCTIGGGTNPVTSIFGSGTINMPAGSITTFALPLANGYAVTASTANRFTLAANSGSQQLYFLLVGH